jgi:hypothetical protein
MSGIHQFTSSQWIQSGSVAQFKTGLEVSGSISATGTITAGTFLGDGSQLTGIADEDFFAGDPSFITASSPSSKDTFLLLESGNKTASATQVVIATTHSEDFIPNYYSFYKLTGNGFETIKSGSESFYSGSDRYPDDLEGFHPYENDLASGTHRYMVNAVDTSSGAGHSLFTTITVKGFVNRPPILELPTNLTLSMDHDADHKSITFELTESTDTNDDDFIRRMSVTRSTVDPIAEGFHRYGLLLENTSDDSDSVSIATQSGEMGTSTGLTSEGLSFTARLETYVSSHNTTHVALPTPVDFTEVIHVTMSDNNQSNNTASNSFTFNIVPPPTASITNIRTQVESGSYTNTVGTYYEVPMLYDRSAVPLNTSSLDGIYTESLVRIRTCAEIQEPPGYSADSDHTTEIAIYENNDQTINNTGKVHWVRIKGHAGTNYTASTYGSQYSEPEIVANTTESNGWIPLDLEVGDHYYGPQTSDSGLLDIDDGVRHGSHNHFSASSGNPIQINVTAIPNVEISDIVVQVESSSFSEISATTRTGSVLYGYTASLLQEDTASLIGDKSVQYISESVIRYRVLARIQEPFGPDHRSTTVDIKTGGTSRNTIYFNTASSDVQTSSSAFDGSNRLVTHYTSSWQSSSFDPGSYVISASFDNLAENAGQTVTAGTYANLLVNQTESIQVNNVKVQIESSSFSGIPTYSRTGSILYGYTATLLQEETSSLLGLTKETEYISESVIRYRVLAKVQEPFGPYDEKTLVDLTDGSVTHNIDFETPDSTNFDNDNRRISHYTSSWYSSSFTSGGPYSLSASFATYSLAADLTASPGEYSSLHIDQTASIQVDEINVQIESSSFSGIPTYSRTGSILYGYTKTLLQEQTSSLLDLTKETEYISESVIRYRVLAKVTEPFGPYDEKTLVTLTGDSGAHSIDFDTPDSETFDNSYRRISHYTSSWYSSSFDVGGPYTFTASFATFSLAADLTASPGNYSSLQISQTASIQVDEIKVQIESSSYSQVPVYSRTGSILYGYTASLLEEHTASLNTYDRAVQYISESVIRYRVLAKVTEPFGPNHESTVVNLTNNNGNHTLAFNTSSTDLFDSGSTYIANRLVSTYTSSWQSSSFNVSTFILSASFDTSSLSALMVPTLGNYSSLEMVQTGSTTISDMEVELETAYGTGLATNTRTSRILYGQSASLKSNETASLLGFDKTNDYISESVIRYRVRGKVVEPFGIETTDIISSVAIGGSGGGGSTHEYLAVESFADSSNIGTATTNFRNVGAKSWTYNSSGNTISGTTGPNNGISATSTASNSEAQSSGQGYIYTEATNNFNQVHTLRTPQLNLDQSTTNEKLVLYFHIKGANISSEPLEIYHGTSATSIGSTPLDYEYYNGTGMVSGPITSQTHDTQSDPFYRLECDISAYRGSGNFYLYIRSLTGTNYSSDVAIDNIHVIGTSGGGGSTETLTFTTASSLDIANTGSEAYTSDHQRILNYTSSWQEYNFDNNIDLSSSFATTENILEVGTSVTSALTMSATLDTIIQSTMSYENKWPNEIPSGIDTDTRSARILYGYNATFLSASLDSSGGVRDQVNYRDTHSTDAVIRHRIKAMVKEPFGPNTTAITIIPNTGSNISISTASADIVSTGSHELYDIDDRKIFSYTSSWFDTIYVAGEHTQSYSVTPVSHTLSNSEAAPPNLLVTAPVNTTIDIIAQVEQTESGSNIGGLSRTSTYIHGLEETTITNQDQTSYSDDAKLQMVRARVLAYVQEPFGPRVSTMSTDLIGSDVNNNVPFVISSGSGINHSETNGSFSYQYTGAFAPIELTYTGTKNVDTNNISPTYGNLTTNKTPSSVEMLARQTSSITINSITPDASHWSGSSGIVTLDPYIVSSNGTPTIDDRILNISVGINPPDISSFTSMDSNNYTITWGDTSNNINATGNDIGYVDLQNIDIYTALETSTVSVVVASDISGDSGIANSTQTVNVLPYKPISMTSAAITDNIPLVTAYLPSSSAWNYEDVNQIGTSVNNIFRTWNGSANDYSLTLSFSDNFNHAESGSLILLINGSNSCSIDLESLFDETSKASNQTLPTVGPLSLTTWGVHNNISQPIYDGAELYTVGYQKFTPQISFTDKLPNDGYNTVQLKRTGIPGGDQLSNLYGFYYDDGAGTASIDAPTPNIWTWNESNSTSPTMSLSGVKYFVNEIPFEISYSGHIEGLASDTYPQPELVRLTTPSGLGLDFDGSYVTNQTDKDIYTGSGLSWETGSTDPTIDDVANISLMAKFEGSSTVGVDKTIDIKALSKNGTYTSASTAAVGRFVNTGSIDSNPDSDTVANFYREDMRIPSSSNLDTLLEASYGDYTYWLTSSNYTYDSTQSLLENNELQQTINGHLVYPNTNYTASNIFNPNAPDYVNADGDRFYYRALEITGLTGTGDRILKLKIGVDSGNPIQESDIWPGAEGEFDSKDIRIRIKMPGPVDGGGNQNAINPGSGWGVITGGWDTAGSPSVDNWYVGASSEFFAYGASGAGSGVAINFNTGTYKPIIPNSIMIVEVRFKATATGSSHKITNLSIEDV